MSTRPSPWTHGLIAFASPTVSNIHARRRSCDCREQHGRGNFSVCLSPHKKQIIQITAVCPAPEFSPCSMGPNWGPLVVARVRGSLEVRPNNGECVLCLFFPWFFFVFFCVGCSVYLPHSLILSLSFFFTTTTTTTVAMATTVTATTTVETTTVAMTAMATGNSIMAANPCRHNNKQMEYSVALYTGELADLIVPCSMP